MHHIGYLLHGPAELLLCWTPNFKPSLKLCTV